MSDDVPSVAKLPTKWGQFDIHVYHEEETGLDHVALMLGSMEGPDPVLMRVHSECLTGDAFSSLRCDCGPQLNAAMQAIVENGWGCLLYLRQEGRGIGLLNKIRAYALQDKGFDTVDANLELGFGVDERTYEVAAEILSHLNISSVDLMSNNPLKRSGLEQHGITVRDSVGCITETNHHNAFYIDTKRERCGHEL